MEVFSWHFFDPRLFHFLCSLSLELEQIYSLEAGTLKNYSLSDLICYYFPFTF